MSTTTPRLGLLKPAGTEAVNQITQINDNYDKVDTNVGAVVCTSSTRPGSPYQGQVIYETNTGLVRVYNGSVWKAISRPNKNAWIKIAGGEIDGVSNFDIDVTQGGKFSASEFECYKITMRGSCSGGPGVVGLRINDNSASTDYNTGRIEWDSALFQNIDQTATRMYAVEWSSTGGQFALWHIINYDATATWHAFGTHFSTNWKNGIGTGRTASNFGQITKLTIGISTGTITAGKYLLEGLVTGS
jgi:hypothetical protein